MLKQADGQRPFARMGPFKNRDGRDLRGRARLAELGSRDDLHHEAGEAGVVDEVGEGATDHGPTPGSPRVRPGRDRVARDREQEMGDARAQVAGRVDRISGRAAERQADDQDEERDRECAEARRSQTALVPKAKITNTSTNVPMISLRRFQV